MATLLQITNKVLVRLRENEVADLSADYSTLIASFIADIVKELDEATIWNFQDHEVTVSVVASTQSYALSATTNESSLLWNELGPACWIWEAGNTTQGTQMTYLDPSEFYRMYQMDRSNTSTLPIYFTVEKDSTNDSLNMLLYPTPSATATIRVRFNTPAAELDPSTDASTEIKMPERLVRLGALYLALNERGEEIGEPGNIAEQRYNAAKGAAIEAEIRARERSGFYDWRRT